MYLPEIVCDSAPLVYICGERGGRREREEGGGRERRGGRRGGKRERKEERREERREGDE